MSTCAALVDTGYATHAPQTLALVQQALGARPLDLIVNTHLHSDHCGGNALLQAAWPCRTADSRIRSRRRARLGRRRA